MKVAADSWYSSATSWTVIAVGVAVVIGVATAWIGWLAVNPKRRLFYEMPVITPLLNAGQIKGLKVLRDDMPVTAPHVLELILASQGRLDIPSSAFDSGAPLRLDVGATILEILKISSTPDQHGIPRVEADDTALQIGPSLIGRRQTTSFSILVDGPRPTLSCPESPLIDVELCHGAPVSAASTARMRVLLKVALATFVAVSLALLAFTTLATRIVHKPNIFTKQLTKPMKGTLPAVAAVVVGGFIWLNPYSPSTPPLIGTVLERFSVALPFDSGLSLHPGHNPLSTQQHGDIVLTKGRLTGNTMIFALPSPAYAGSNSFWNCFFPNALSITRSIALPQPHQTICAAGFSGLAALTVISVNKRYVALRVTVWQGTIVQF